MSYRYCAVVGCHNSGRGLKKWKDGFCNIHQMNYGMGKCICEPPFRLFPFPTELQDLEGRWRWIKNVNRLDRKTGKLWIPSVNCRICSKHFVDGEPSLSNPNPTLFMGHSEPSLSNPNPTLFMGLSDSSLGKKARRQMSRDAIKLVFRVSDQVCHNRAVQPHKMARGSVFAKTAGLSDKTDKFQKCPANFVSLPDSMSEEESIQKTPGQCFLVTWSSMNEDCTYFLHIFHQISTQLQEEDSYEMQSSDLPVDEAGIKDLPGYKVIMKSVLKHQIQILVEQLSETTGDESILLTASVSDGATSHLGTRCGKTFLDGQEEFKSQFLNYVQKLYLNKKTKEEVTSRSKKGQEVLVCPKENDLLVHCINPPTLKTNQMTYFMRPAAEQFSRGQAETPVPSSVLTTNTASGGKTSSTLETKQRVVAPRQTYIQCYTSQEETPLQRKTCTTKTNGGVLSLVKQNVCTIIPKKGVLSLPTNTIVLNAGILPPMQGSVANVPPVIRIGTAESMGNMKAAEVATSHSEIKVGSKRSAVDVRNTIKSDKLVTDGDLEDRRVRGQEQSESAVPGPVPVKCTPVVPVSGPIPVVPNLKNYDSSQEGVLELAVPKLEPEDTFEAQKGGDGSTESPVAERDSLNLDYVVVKQEVEVDNEMEEAGVAEEVDPDWVPGDWEPAEEESQDSDWEPPVAKKQRKGSDSSSVSSQVYECGVQTPSEGMVPTSSHEAMETTLSTDQPPEELDKQTEEPDINPNEQKTPVEKPVRFKVVTEEELQMIENPKQSLSTQRNTKWGTKLFQAWSCETFGADTDFKNIEAEDLNKKLQKFYLAATPKEVEHRKKNMPELQASEYRKNTLKNVRAAINRHLKDIGRPFDIAKDKEFSTANKCLDGKILHNRRQGAYVPVQHKEISAADLLKIHIYLGTKSQPVILRYKVWFDLSFHFNPKTLAFHQHLNLKSFEFLKDDKGVEHAILTDETRQEIRKALLSEEASMNRVLYATGTETCPVKSLKLLIEKTPPECGSLFNNCSDEALKNPDSQKYWYRDRAIKSYQFVKFMSKICENAKCSQLYTTQCLRATAAKAMNGGLQIGRVEATIGTVMLSQSKQSMLLPKPQ